MVTWNRLSHTKFVRVLEFNDQEFFLYQYYLTESMEIAKFHLIYKMKFPAFELYLLLYTVILVFQQKNNGTRMDGP